MKIIGLTVSSCLFEIQVLHKKTLKELLELELETRIIRDKGKTIRIQRITEFKEKNQIKSLFNKTLSLKCSEMRNASRYLSNGDSTQKQS